MANFGASTGQEFRSGLPPREDSSPYSPVYEIKLEERGEIAAGTIIRAYFDYSEQYKADGTCWRAADN